MGHEHLTRATPSSISLREIMQGYHEVDKRTVPNPEKLAHPDAVTNTIGLVLQYADTFLGHGLRVRGSLARHVAAKDILTNNDQGKILIRTGGFDINSELPGYEYVEPGHFYIGTHLRDRLLPEMSRELRNVEKRAPEVANTFYRLLPGPDFDLKMPPTVTDEDETRQAQFLASLPTHLLPFLADSIATGDIHKNQADVRDRVTALDLDDGYSPHSPKVTMIESTDLPSGWDSAALVDVDVLIPPARPTDFDVFVPHKPKKLIIYSETIHSRIDINSLVLAADLRDTPEEPLDVDKIHPFIKIEFTKTRPPEETSSIDGRGVISYDTAHVDLVVEDQEIRFGVPEPTKDVYTVPVALNEAWEKRTPTDALEIASRALWQAIDTEVQGVKQPDSDYYVSMESRDRINQHLRNCETTDPHVWETVSEHQKDQIQLSMLLAMVYSPNRFLEYFDESGIWQILQNKYGSKLPRWEQALGNMFRAGHQTQPDYLDQIYYGQPLNSGKSFTSGWKIIDEACGLKDIFPDKESYLERVYALTRL